VNKTFKNVIFAAAGVLFAQAVGTLRSFVLAKLIEPAEYGIWTGAQTVASLSPILCLGTVEALLKRVPYFRGRNDLAGLRKVEDSVFATLALAATALAAVFLMVPGLIPSKFVHDNLLVVQVTAAAAAIGFFSAFYYQRCAAYEDFRSASLIDGVRSLISSGCVLALAWKWGLVGGVFGFFLGELLTWAISGLICGRAHGTVHLNLKPSLMADAVRVGFPITIIWWVYIIHSNIGRMTAIAYLGNTQTGYYGVGMSIAMIFSLIPNTIGRVFYPRVNAQIGAQASLQDLRESVVMPTSAIAMVLPVSQVIIFYLLPVVYNDLLPKYRPGLACAQILILGAFFVGLIRNGANYLIAADKQLLMMKYVVISVAANAVGSVALTKLGFGINGIAFATSAASALLASLIWSRVFVELGYERHHRLALLGNFYIPFLGTLFAIGVVRFGFLRVAHISTLMLQVQMLLTLGIVSGIIAAFPQTRNRAKDLCRRALNIFAVRLGQPVTQ
jgi:O-antigen/teichoic acid export membrane protein